MVVQGFIMGTFAAYWWGHAVGQRNASRDYQEALENAKDDYKEAARRVEKMRNRLMATRWLKARTGKDKRRARVTTGNPEGNAK
jgi:hypothetical protein